VVCWGESVFNQPHFSFTQKSLKTHDRVNSISYNIGLIKPSRLKIWIEYPYKGMTMNRLSLTLMSCFFLALSSIAFSQDAAVPLEPRIPEPNVVSESEMKSSNELTLIFGSIF